MRGRPQIPAKDGVRNSLGLKVTAQIKRALSAAAKKSGRTMSQEAEHRLELSFHNERLIAQIIAAVRK